MPRKRESDTDDTINSKRRRPRRSHGCEACKSRRMKCSEVRPICNECGKRGQGQDCSYEDHRVIFQSENLFVEKNFRTKDIERKASRSDSTSAVPLRSSSELEKSRHDNDLRSKASGSLADFRKKSSSSSPCNVLVATRLDSLIEPSTNCSSASPWIRAVSKQYLASDEIIPGHGYSQRWSTPDASPAYALVTQDSIAVSVFFQDFLPSERILSDHESWSKLLQSAIHHNEILRNIVMAISRSKIGLVYTEYHAARENKIHSLENYEQALKALQPVLNDHEKALTDDTLYAVSLLGVYEILRGTSPISLAQHVEGGMSLLRARGPAAHAKGGIIGQITAAYQSDAIRRSIETGQRTFFSEKNWIVASRHWQPIASHAYCGSELNLFLLRLTELNAKDGYNVDKARTFKDELLLQRRYRCAQKFLLSNASLERQSVRAQQLALTQSPFGSHSISYDPPHAGSYNHTFAAITFDWILLTLYLTYPALLVAKDTGHDLMCSMVQSIQYVLNDERNQTQAIVIMLYYDMINPLVTCGPWSRTGTEIDWISHLINISAISLSGQIGGLAKARIRETLVSERMVENKISVEQFMSNSGIFVTTGWSAE